MSSNDRIFSRRSIVTARDLELERYFNGGGTHGYMRSAPQPARAGAVAEGRERARRRWVIGGTIAAGLLVLGSAAGSARHLIAAPH